jgi:hypothetical protein
MLDRIYYQLCASMSFSEIAHSPVLVYKAKFPKGAGIYMSQQISNRFSTIGRILVSDLLNYEVKLLLTVPLKLHRTILSHLD